MESRKNGEIASSETNKLSFDFVFKGEYIAFGAHVGNSDTKGYARRL